MSGGFSLKTLGLIWVAFAFVVGLTVSSIWSMSARSWDAHLTKAYVTGFSVYETLRTGTPPPDGVDVSYLSNADRVLADRGLFARMPTAPLPSFVTMASVLTSTANEFTDDTLTIAIVSDELQYRVADLVSSAEQTAAEKMANLTRLLATYCSEPILYVRMGQTSWRKVDGREIWGCQASPTDYRLASVIAGLVAAAILYTLITDTSATFHQFASAVRGRRRFGGPEAYPEEGPAELRDMVDAVNSYLAREREQLAHRAVVLSGVSHDLGTPATRLRLRTALITDDTLRDKLDEDIDRMTGMIESVLTYTRSEMSTEEPRQLSLSSLVQALVDDYQDMGKPVEFQSTTPTIVEGGRSVFMSVQSHTSLTEELRILVTARPLSLQRAITNLIENALKYGRRATVSLTATSDTATITVEDEGDMRPEDISELTAPFKRGENVGAVSGYGLGLTIVATVAEQHGGALDFERGAKGLRAVFTLQRT